MTTLASRFVRSQGQTYDRSVRRSPATLLAELRRTPGKASVVLGLVLAVAVTPAIFAPGLYDDFTLAKQATLLIATALILAGLAWDGEFLPRQKAVRVLLLSWTALLAVSFATGIDSRGSILGYYQYRQGLLTQTAYIALFLGANRVARDGAWRWLPVAGTIGLASVTAYTAIQAIGRDPFNWWVDTSARAIGTIGNANELAAYAVIALAFCGLAMRSSGKTAWLGVAAVAVCSSFVVVESGSRSGLLALGTVLVAHPLASFAIGHRWREWSPRWLLLCGGVLFGLALSAAAGGAAGTASRVQVGLAHSETSGSTRVELWKGTIATISQSPILGYGPDGLFLAFPRHRPAELSGAFLDYDLVAQSSHNAALDIAANQGIPALLVLIAMFSLVAFRSMRHERRERAPDLPFVWAAMAGYVALTMVNPVSIAPHALFFVLVGTLNGRTEGNLPAPTRMMVRPSVRLALALPGCIALIAVAALMPVADWRANRAWSNFAGGDFESATIDYRKAHGLLPFERHYAAKVAVALLATGVGGGSPSLRESIRAYESFDRQFGFSSAEAIGLATARIGLGDTTGIDALVARSLQLNPQGVSMQAYTETLRAAAKAGGTLHYSAKDRWVYVVSTRP